jgi:hypothetical protein
LFGLQSQHSVKRYWGKEVENILRIFQDRLDHGSVVQVRWGVGAKSKASKIVDGASVRGLEPGVVSFPGQGRYSPHKQESERFVRWSDLEPSDPELAWDMTGIVPMESGWWPAVQVGWKDEAAEHGRAANVSEYYKGQARGSQVVYVVCWYQLVDDTMFLTAWPTRIWNKPLSPM